MNNDQLLGELKQATETLQKDAKTLYDSNSNRKNEINKVGAALAEESSQRKFELERVLHAVEENNNIAAGVIQKVDNIASDVHGLATRFDGLETTVNDMKQNQFNWSKFMKGCISPKGLFLIFVMGFFVTTIFLSMFAPETLPEFFKSVPKGGKL